VPQFCELEKKVKRGCLEHLTVEKYEQNMKKKYEVKKVRY
jgi:hypothetical protein